MLEQKAECNEVLFAARKFRDVLRDGVVEVNLALVEQNHEGGSRADDLGERCEIVDALGLADDGAFIRPVEATEAALPDSGALAPDDDGGTGIAARLDATHNDMVNLG